MFTTEYIALRPPHYAGWRPLDVADCKVKVYAGSIVATSLGAELDVG